MLKNRLAINQSKIVSRIKKNMAKLGKWFLFKINLKYINVDNLSISINKVYAHQTSTAGLFLLGF